MSNSHITGIRDTLGRSVRRDRAMNDREHSMPPLSPAIARVLSDPCASFWLKNALRAALIRDPVDAANDAEVLFRLLDDWCREILRR